MPAGAQITVPGAGIIQTVAGGGSSGTCSGPATACDLGTVRGVAAEASGNIYIASLWACDVWKVTASTGNIAKVAGNGSCGYSGDNGLAATAELNEPRGVAVDSLGNIYISDQENYRIRMVCASATSPVHGTTCPAAGDIITAAGNGISGYLGDGGAATSAELSQPQGIGLDGQGNLYIADEFNNVVRKVTVLTGKISTVAGNGTSGYSGDGGAPTSARLNDPDDVALDPLGNIDIADFANSVIRKVTVSTGLISPVAGDGGAGFSGDGGAATSAEIDLPTGVAVDSVGNFYISDYYSAALRKVSVATGIISTIAGNGTSGYSGDGGAATSAEINQPYAMTLDTSGNLYIADSQNSRIRAVGTAEVRFSPAAGTYTGSQTVSLSCSPSSGTSIWYTTNGYPASTASTLYTGPVTVSSNTTIRAICAYTGDTEVNVQTSLCELEVQRARRPGNFEWLDVQRKWRRFRVFEFVQLHSGFARVHGRIHHSHRPHQCIAVHPYSNHRL